VIETSRTIIRPYTGSEAPLLAPIFSDPTTMTMSFWERPPDEAAVAAWVARATREFCETGMGKMLVVDRRTGEPIGDCGIMRAEVGGRPENNLGYIIHHPYWGAGLGTECARACLEYGLRAVELRRVVANMPYDHAASRRVAEKLGMRWECSFPNPRNRGILTHLYALDGGTVGERVEVRAGARGRSGHRERVLRRRALPRPSRNPQARASLLAITRVMAAWTNASPVEHSRSWSFAILLLCEIQAKVRSTIQRLGSTRKPRGGRRFCQLTSRPSSDHHSLAHSKSIFSGAGFGVWRTTSADQLRFFSTQSPPLS